MRRPGLTEDEGATSAGFVEVAVSGMRVEVDDEAALSNEVWVIVDVEDEDERLGVADDVPRWVSLSSAQKVSDALLELQAASRGVGTQRFRDLGNFHDDILAGGLELACGWGGSVVVARDTGRREMENARGVEGKRDSRRICFTRGSVSGGWWWWWWRWECICNVMGVGGRRKVVGQTSWEWLWGSLWNGLDACCRW